MDPLTAFADRRIAARAAQLDGIAAAADRHGATALHLFGSLGRRSADALSDIDAWLTFPDDSIDAAIRDRFDLYRDVGNLLLMHEAKPNRPLGGVYALVLYQTAAGPMVVDWYLAPQRTSRVELPAKTIYEHVPVSRGERLLDTAAQQEYALDERVSWLICVLFVAIKMNIRGKEASFLDFLGRAYREVRDTYRLDGLVATDPASLADIDAMLGQLAPHAQDQQLRAIDAIRAFVLEVARDRPTV